MTDTAVFEILWGCLVGVFTFLIGRKALRQAHAVTLASAVAVYGEHDF